MLKRILMFIRDNAVYAANTDVLNDTDREILTAARVAGFVRVVNARFMLTSEGKSYLEMCR